MIRISAAEFDRVVEDALASVPSSFRDHLDNISVEVRDRPDASLLDSDEESSELLGLYVGIPVTEQSVDGGAGELPGQILIFRDNLCEMCVSREELFDEIRITILHEIGHHFGLDDNRLGELGYG